MLKGALSGLALLALSAGGLTAPRSTSAPLVEAIVPFNPPLPEQALNRIADRIYDDLVRHAPEALESLNSLLKDMEADKQHTSRSMAAVLKRLEGTRHFDVLWMTTVRQACRDQTLWSRIGYQGSSIEHGGYIDRGFDDIDWL